MTSSRRLVWQSETVLWGWPLDPASLVGSVFTTWHCGTRMALEYQNWQVHCLCPMPFTDESRFTLSTCNRCERFWRSCAVASFSITGLGQWWSGEAYSWRDAQTSTGSPTLPWLPLGIMMKSFHPLWSGRRPPRIISHLITHILMLSGMHIHWSHANYRVPFWVAPMKFQLNGLACCVILWLSFSGCHFHQTAWDPFVPNTLPGLHNLYLVKIV